MIQAVLYIAVAAALLLFLPRMAQAAPTPTGRRYPFDELFRKFSRLYGVPMRVMLAVVQHESAFNPRATNQETEADKRKGRDVVSIGLGQILFPDTATALKPGVTRDELLDPELNLDLAFQVMAGNLRRWPIKDADGFPAHAVAAYNAGSPRLVPGGTEYVNQRYVNAVKANWRGYAELGT